MVSYPGIFTMLVLSMTVTSSAGISVLLRDTIIGTWGHRFLH